MTGVNELLDSGLPRVAGTDPQHPAQTARGFSQAAESALDAAPGSSRENPLTVRSLKEAVKARKGHAFNQGPFVRLDQAYELGGSFPHGEKNLTRIDFNRASLKNGGALVGLDLRGSVLDDVYFPNIKIQWCMLQGASLVKANLTQAEITDSDLSGANLQSADLNGAYLVWVALRSASLVGADLSGARVWANATRKTDMTGANIWGAKLGRFAIDGARSNDPMRVLGAVRTNPETATS